MLGVAQETTSKERMSRRVLWHSRRTVVDRNSPHDLLHVHAIPRNFAGVHFDDDARHCPDVSGGAYSWTACLGIQESFGRHIVECALDACGQTPGCRAHDLGDAKVSEDRLVKGIEEDVWWLDIPHHKTTPM
jgi:hypothetical protein